MSTVNLESQRRKDKVYATFQFISFVAYFLMIIAFVMVISADDFFIRSFNDRYVESVVGRVFTMLFTYGLVTPAGIIYSTLVYIGIAAIPLSWIAGLFIAREEERTLTDSLFVLFVIIPVLSNMFALIAQVSNSEILVNKDDVDKKIEYTRQLELARQNKRDELDRLEQELQILTKEHNIAIHKIYKKKKEKGWGIPMFNQKSKGKKKDVDLEEHDIVVKMRPTKVNPFIQSKPLEVLNVKAIEEVKGPVDVPSVNDVKEKVKLDIEKAKPKPRAPKAKKDIESKEK